MFCFFCTLSFQKFLCHCFNLQFHSLNDNLSCHFILEKQIPLHPQNIVIEMIMVNQAIWNEYWSHLKLLLQIMSINMILDGFLDLSLSYRKTLIYRIANTWRWWYYWLFGWWYRVWKFGERYFRGIFTFITNHIKALRPKLETTQNSYSMIKYSGVHPWTSSGFQGKRPLLINLVATT